MALIDEVQGSAESSMIVGANRRRLDEKKEGGIMAWFGRVFGCGDSRSKS